MKAATLRTNRYPGYAWAGITLGILVQILLILKIRFAAVWLTPLMWTAYILAADGWLALKTGRSWLTSRRREFPLLALLSIAIWLIFEAYNFHLQNWLYGGVPASPILRDLAYLWSFATILPGVFLTSELLEQWLPPTLTLRRLPSLLQGWPAFLLGATMITVPLALPVPLARYSIASVWLGFIFLLEPVNARLGAGSSGRLIREGNGRRVLALLLGGFLCGLLWEAWNYQAFLAQGGHWIYTIPATLRVFGLHYGQMPVLGMFGFPPFALELYALYHLLRALLDGERLLGPPAW